MVPSAITNKPTPHSLSQICHTRNKENLASVIKEAVSVSLCSSRSCYIWRNNIETILSKQNSRADLVSVLTKSDSNNFNNQIQSDFLLKAKQHCRVS